MRSLWMKFFLCYAFPISLLALLWFFLFSVNTRQTEMENLLQYRKRLNTQKVSALETNFNVLQEQIYMVYSDNESLQTIYEGPSAKGYYSARKKFSQMIQNFFEASEYMDGLILLDTEGNMRLQVNNKGNSVYFPNIERSDWYLNALHKEHAPVAFSAVNFQGKELPLVGCSRIIYDGISRKEIGMVMCFCYMENFVEKIKNGKMLEEEYFQILNETGEIVYENMLDSMYQWELLEKRTDYDLYLQQGEMMMCTSVRGSSSGWTVAVYTPYLMPNTLELLQDNKLLLTLLSFIFLSLLISTVLSKGVAKPLKLLTDSFGEVEKGNFGVRLRLSGKDELAQIGKAYNHMLEQITFLMRQQYELKISNMQAKLDVLQSQINPHFLFNTLNSMKAVSDSENARVTAQMIQALSDLMRYSLRKKEGLVPFKKEVQMIREYLYLQGLRYVDRFAVEYEIEEETECIEIPCLILQPLVENAIKYGLSKQTHGGRLILMAKLIQGELFIYVSNTGTLIPEKKLQEINAKLESLSESTEIPEEHIGLLNVGYRLKLQYGKACRMRINSGQFTTVKLVIPGKRYMSAEYMDSLYLMNKEEKWDGEKN